MTNIIIKIFASTNSLLDNLLPKICFGKKLRIIPQTSAAIAKTQKSVINIPFKEASPFLSFLWLNLEKNLKYAPEKPRLNKLR